ncbi:MAG: nuclear transport factor 2 family protein [Betaproteobacteria bacterium]|nr:MAG: nuclear transport factor 2 family protein [Betaproteobacteria bacterium]
MNLEPGSPFAANRAFVYHGAMMYSINRMAFAWMCVTLLAWAASASAADEQATGGRVPTVTRLVKMFTEQETALASAIRAGDSSAVERLLTDDFEMRMGAMPANPVPRSEWLSEMMRTRKPGDDVSGMAVHDLNGAAIVSFVQGRGQTAIFVVDVWRAATNDWKLAIRYAAPAGSAAFATPGAGATTPPVIPKKY